MKYKLPQIYDHLVNFHIILLILIVNPLKKDYEIFIWEEVILIINILFYIYLSISRYNY